ncbi:4'-phosphopantetheinyl transferase family protein [Lacrimispora sp.]|jgi:4'-phosphopantetheinyl transferase|uniref:4'-phosphopantetheinyl transferase family protein n=1 Tax=Lacrimispora sp. TaxID=2719234 RepID=UPI0028B0E1BE|nr:4'-phosphopantetheinyl transferase superfamily protein [Lacrimispora sp.]
MKIFFMEVSEKENNKTNNLLKLVSEKRQETLRRYRFPIDRKLSLYAELLVRKQAMRLLGLNNDEIKFGTNEYCKPFIQGHTQFQFNISHTRNAIAVAFSSHEVGVDIERINPPDYQISKQFFTFFEHNYILSHKNPNRAFYEIWTKKEAYTKCIGTGLTKPLKSFDVLNTEISTLMYMYEIGEYIISYCSNEPTTEEHSFIILTEDEILQSD